MCKGITMGARAWGNRPFCLSEAEWVGGREGCGHQISSLESGTVHGQSILVIQGWGAWVEEGRYFLGHRTLITNTGKPVGKLGWVGHPAWHLRETEEGS